MLTLCSVVLIFPTEQSGSVSPNRDAQVGTGCECVDRVVNILSAFSVVWVQIVHAFGTESHLSSLAKITALYVYLF